MIDREAAEANQVYDEYKERVRKEKEDEAFYKSVAKFDRARNDLYAE